MSTGGRVPKERNPGCESRYHDVTVYSEEYVHAPVRCDRAQCNLGGRMVAPLLPLCTACSLHVRMRAT